MVAAGPRPDLARLAGGIPPPADRCGARLRRGAARARHVPLLAAVARRPPARRGAERARSPPGCGSASISTSPSASRRTARPPGRTARSSSRRADRRAARLFQRRRPGLGAGAALAGRCSSARSFEPYPRRARRGASRHAGALRIDHAMSLYRLFWIADRLQRRRRRLCPLPVRRHAADARRGLAGAPGDRHRRGSRRRAGRLSRGDAAAEIQSYRVFFFEKRDDDFFFPPEHYPREALACITTHDLHTLAGWWSGHDIDVRDEIGMIGGRPRSGRARRTARMSGGGARAARRAGPAAAGDGAGHARRGEAPRELPESLAVALHRLLARTPSRLFVVPAEDLTGALDQVNIPGTVDEHPNWRRKLAVDLRTLPDRAALPRDHRGAPRGAAEILGNPHARRTALRALALPRMCPPP